MRKTGDYTTWRMASFHVEQPLRLHVARSHPDIGNRGQEKLRAGGLQFRQASASTVRIQLRRDVVDQHHRGIPEHRGQIQNLRDRDRSDEKLRLTTGKRVPQGPTADREPEICAMWPHLRMAPQPIALSVNAHMPVRATDSNPIPDRTGYCRSPEQRSYDIIHRPQCPAQVSHALLRQQFPRFRQLRVPGTKIADPGTAANRRVALAQRTPVSPMVLQVGWFHVKQQPIDDPSPKVRTIGDQAMRVRSHRDRRQKRRQLGCRPDVGAAATDPQPLGCMFDSGCFGDSVRTDRPPHDAQGGFSVGDDITQTVRPEGPARPEDVNRFQKARLSAAVRSNHQIDARRELQTDSVEDSKMPNLDGCDAHDRAFRRPMSNPLPRVANRCEIAARAAWASLRTDNSIVHEAGSGNCWRNP